MDEKGHQPGSGSAPTAADHSDIESAADPEKLSTSSGGPNFEPIRPGTAAAAHPTSHNNRRLSAETIDTLRRERSNNGWGCDDIEADAAGGIIAPYNHPGKGGADGGSGGNRDGNGNGSGSGSGSGPDGAPADPFEVGWDGGDSDPMCPRSFPTWRKWLIIAITSVGSFCVTNASASYTATYAQMNEEFDNSRLVATLGLSTFVLGIALGPFWSPLAEFYGRRPIYLCSFAGFIIWLVPSAVAKNIETMIVARFFQGLAGSAFLSVSGGTVGDLFTRDTMLAPMAIFALAPFVGPSTGPLVGGLINTYVNWRWTHYVLLIWAAVLLLTIALFVPETYHPVLLKRKAQKLRKTTGDDRWRAPLEKSTKSVSKTVAYSLLRPFQILIFEPMAVVLNIYTAVLLGLLYLFFGAFPLIFRTNHGFNLWQVGLTFMGLLVAMIIACLSTPLWTRLRQNMVAKRHKETGVLKDEPEDQLPPVIFGAPLITGGLFWFGFTTYPEIHWIVPIIGSSVFGLGSTHTHGTQRAPWHPMPWSGVPSQMYEALGFQWATGLVAFVTLALMPFPYIFFRYGKKIRARSRYATTT
ncbi:major facilitator superfamily domain-containing protein [Chaetomium fimeti]|uniref:Major facilitator superfamily domain-containing protein n=1 Tax=Chaetomium fimeti TaxID=1854472 RepID=A0AAE0LPM1_9PEZI|nr:major facilitator superfamily domain-containing protein [Chaetomium fimeti]